MVLTLYSVWAVSAVGYRTRSKVFKKSSFLIFLLTVFNTGVLLYFANANITIAIP